MADPKSRIVGPNHARPRENCGGTPRAIDCEVTEVLHRTDEGVDLDAENIP